MPQYGWPPQLPQQPQKGYSESVGVLVARTPTDKGPAKLRRLGDKPKVLNLSYILTSKQVLDLENFVVNQIKGVSKFSFIHPRTNSSVDVRFVPQGEGDYYTISHMVGTYYSVNIVLEVLP